MKTLQQILETENENAHAGGKFGLDACRNAVKSDLKHTKGATLFSLLENYYGRCSDAFFNKTMVLACWQLINEGYTQEEKAETYNFEWTTEEAVIANMNTPRIFRGWSAEPMTLAQITGTTSEQNYSMAHALWLKLKDAFNAEAKDYKADCSTYRSALGSVGEIDRREVCRSDWWNTLDGDRYGDYDKLTLIIEILHSGEQLETGKISFGS